MIERTRTAKQDARWQHLYRLLCHEHTDAAGERTEADAAQYQAQQAERRQQADDARMYG